MGSSGSRCYSIYVFIYFVIWPRFALTIHSKYVSISNNQETETTGAHDGLGDIPLKVSERTRKYYG